MKKPSDGITRRQFVKGVAAAATATAVFPQIVPRRVVGGAGYTPPSETLLVAGIGASMMGTQDMRSAVRAGAKIVAISDVDANRVKDTFKEHSITKNYIDYREMLEKEKNIDAVIVATPDHTHGVLTNDVIENGQHVYCEKPLARTVYEVRKMAEMARKHGVVAQLGNQGRSFNSCREFCECIWSGAIGEVREVHATQAAFGYSRIDQLGNLNDNHAVPDGMDWDRWLGPAPFRKFSPMYHPGAWRGWRQFGGGNIGDFVCHIIDPVFWALDLHAPDSVVAEVGDYDPEKHAETFPKSSKVTWQFSARGQRAPVTVSWYDGDKYQPPRPEGIKPGEEVIPVPGWRPGAPVGAMVVGDKGTIVYGSHGASGWRILDDDQMKAYMGDRSRAVDDKTEGPPSNFFHLQNWIAACKGWKKANSDFDTGGALTEIAMVGNIAQLMPETELHWDAKHMTFVNHPAANQHLHGEYRDGWTL
jgi:predicted dehydrogenase